MSTLWLPKHLRPARKPVAIVFYYSKKHDRMMVGFPENYPVPEVLRKQGFEKIVCRSAAEVDRWSQKYREQERREQEISDEQRHEIEAPLRAILRAELVSKMLTSHNAVNRDFCKAALAKIDEDENRRRMERVSFQHVEGYEDGK